MPPSVSDAIRKKFRDAMRAQAEGKADIARAGYASILKQNVTLAEAHFQLGRLEVDQGNPQKALTHLMRARRLRPDEPEVWKMSLKALLVLRDRPGIRKLLSQAAKAPIPKAAKAELQRRAMGSVTTGGIDPAHVQGIIRRIEQHQFNAAREDAAGLRDAAPKTAIFHALVAACDAGLGDIEDARQGYQRAIALDPNYLEAHLHLGQIELRQRQFKSAQDVLARAWDLGPDTPLVAKFLGIALAEDGSHRRAMPHLQAARRALPDDAEIALHLGRAFLALGQPAEALDILKPLADTTGQVEVLRLIGEAQAVLGDEKAANTAFDAALAQSPDDFETLSARALARATFGAFAEAEEDLNRCLDIAPRNGGLYRLWAVGRQVTAGDPMIDRMLSLYDSGQAQGETQAELAFALAKAMEDIGAYERVFRYLDDGNRLLHAAHPWNPDVVSAETDALFDAYDKGGPAPVHGDRALRGPIFITGLPRSGTTLVERILARHSMVTAGGELDSAREPILDVARAADAEDRPIPPQEFTQTGKRINEIIAARFGAQAVVTDKGMGTYQVAGLVRRALPGARVIVIRRDPRDVCLSLYKNYFRPGTYRYTTDLVALGNYYLFFARTIERWRERDPDAFVEFAYEDLVSDPEKEARRLVAACGLPWEDGCVDPQRDAGRISTLSLFQARQAVYDTSVAAWKRYEDDLGRLLETLKKGGAID